MRRQIIKGVALAAAGLALLAQSPAWAESGAQEYYKGKSIKWIVPYKPGGGYDKYSRLISPFFEKHSGARVDIVNMPGAGGMKGANEIFKSPADGLTVGIINGSALVTNELAGIKGAVYKVADYSYLGRLTADLRVLVTGTNNKYATIEDVLKTKETITIGATGLGGSTYVDAVITGKVFDLNQKVVHGFDSSSVIRQAMLRGDVTGMWGSYGSARKGVASGAHRIILQSGETRSQLIPDVPTVFEIAEKTKDPKAAAEILRAWGALSEVGRPVAAPPGVPADRLAFLRKSFDAAMNDPEFLAKAEQAKRTIYYKSGEDMKSVAIAATGISGDIRKMFIAAIRGEI